MMQESLGQPSILHLLLGMPDVVTKHLLVPAGSFGRGIYRAINRDWRRLVWNSGLNVNIQEPRGRILYDIVRGDPAVTAEVLALPNVYSGIGPYEYGKCSPAWGPSVKTFMKIMQYFQVRPRMYGDILPSNSRNTITLYVIGRIKRDHGQVSCYCAYCMTNHETNHRYRHYVKHHPQKILQWLKRPVNFDIRDLTQFWFLYDLYARDGAGSNPSITEFLKLYPECLPGVLMYGSDQFINAHVTAEVCLDEYIPRYLYRLSSVRHLCKILDPAVVFRAIAQYSFGADWLSRALQILSAEIPDRFDAQVQLRILDYWCMYTMLYDGKKLNLSGENMKHTVEKLGLSVSMITKVGGHKYILCFLARLESVSMQSIDPFEYEPEILEVLLRDGWAKLCRVHSRPNPSTSSSPEAVFAVIDKLYGTRKPKIVRLYRGILDKYYSRVSS